MNPISKKYSNGNNPKYLRHSRVLYLLFNAMHFFIPVRLDQKSEETTSLLHYYVKIIFRSLDRRVRMFGANYAKVCFLFLVLFSNRAHCLAMTGNNLAINMFLLNILM